MKIKIEQQLINNADRYSKNFIDRLSARNQWKIDTPQAAHSGYHNSLNFKN